MLILPDQLIIKIFWIFRKSGAIKFIIIGINSSQQTIKRINRNESNMEKIVDKNSSDFCLPILI